jgi:hypothetical protein
MYAAKENGEKTDTIKKNFHQYNKCFSDFFFFFLLSNYFKFMIKNQKSSLHSENGSETLIG